MNITKAVSDVKTFRTVLPFKDRKAFTGNLYRAYPVFHRWCNPNDIWRTDCQAFIRLQPMLAPPLTENNLRLRWFFVSLRQIEPDLTPLIITGSNDGKLSEEALPEFPSVFEWLSMTAIDTLTINANSLLHLYFNIPVGSYSGDDIDVLKSSKATPRLYWLKAFIRILWDYYRDENLGFEIFGLNMADYDSFEDFISGLASVVAGDHTILSSPCPSVLLKKDYFTSSSPWILKGTQPSIVSNLINPKLTWNNLESFAEPQGDNRLLFGAGSLEHSLSAGLESQAQQTGQYANPVNVTNANKNIQHFLDNIDVDSLGFGFNMNDWRDMKAQWNVLERLAMCGSRYTEYLRANFNIAPADETLQRAVYLGGFKQNILTNEVIQTAQDGDNPVGTMRGHGISFGTNGMRPYLCKEFGMLIAIADVRPNLVYTQGVNREFTYASRYDFMNPSFQNLSQQGIRKGEIYYAPDTDLNGKPRNDEIFGFTGMYNEMRVGKEIMCGEFGSGGSMSFWNQAISFSSRPSLSTEFLIGENYNADSQRPFGVNDVETNPIIFDFIFKSRPARQLVRNPIPKP